MPATDVPALVLIYDIRGFTSASKRMRTAEIGAFATAAHETILHLFADCPPTFVKNLGDGHLLLWETAKVPDPGLLDRVVRHAGEARTAFAAFVAGQGAAGEALPKHVGLGVAWGEVSRSDDYYGVALNLAARLQNLARPEGLALDATVFDSVAARDAALREEFKKARVHLKGLGRTLVWVKRPFSWARVLGKALRVAAVLAIPLAYAALADARVAVPGGDALRRFLDGREWSMFRPVRGDAEVRAAAEGHRRTLFAALVDARSPEGWVLGSFKDRTQAVVDVWSSSQGFCALFRSPEATNESLRALLPGFATTFRDDVLVTVGGVPWGWPAHSGFAYTEAEPTLWTVAATAAALGRPGLVPASERAEWTRRLEVAQRAADLYRPLEDGGWNMFPRQKDEAHHNPYSTTLALLALLETHAAGLGWEGDVAKRDALLKSTATWIGKRFTEHGGRRGWRGTPDESDPVSLGLTLQVVSELLRAEAQAGIAVPAPVLAEVPRLLEGLEGLSIQDPYDAGESSVEFTTHKGVVDSRNESINFLWHPWAIEAACRWLARAREPGADPGDGVRVRRALGHLVVDVGDEAVAASRAGFVFIASETLYGLEAVPVPAR